ncbi:MAG TPA: peptidoglycan DD-metalloendopeptidase family protein [Allocoleopsis sp.]
MKRRFTQKVKKVPACAADSFEALVKLYVGKHPFGAAIPADVNRRARTSAAMIGLAISMGTTGLLLTQQGDEAVAVEPVAVEPNIPSPPVESSTTVSPAYVAEPTILATAKLSMPAPSTTPADFKPNSLPAVEHQVKKGETLWELSKSYEVQPEAIAASNGFKSSAVLPVGQKLKIPSVNGIVHEVKEGETVEALSKSYGVEPTQLQSGASVSESGQLKTGESVTVPGNVNDLLKARQTLALNNLKEQKNRLNDSLAELRSEESTNLSELATVPKAAESTAAPLTPVTLPSAVLTPQTPIASASPSGVHGANPVVIPVPTPELAATPTSGNAARQLQSPVVIPVPTPELAATPIIEQKTARQMQSPVVLPTPSPEIAASPVLQHRSTQSLDAPVVIPVPTPEMAISPALEPKTAQTPDVALNPVTTPEAVTKPQVPQRVLMQTLPSDAASNVYKVKPGDTLDAIARRYGISRTEIARTNGIDNPNLLSINQQIRIPQAQSSNTTNPTIALLPGLNSKSGSSASGQEQQGVTIPTVALASVPDRATLTAPTAVASDAQAPSRTILAQSTVASSEPANSTVAIDSKRSQPANDQNNPYVEKLRADILKLREQYRQTSASGQTTAAVDIAVPTVTMPIASSRDNSSTSTRINPEFKPNPRNENLQAERERQQQPWLSQKGPIPIEVPPPETNRLGAPQDLVASAPAPADSYNPMIRTPVGQTVSPKLPPLNAPDMYLPENSTQFNGYIWPTKGVLTSGYGMRWGRMHKGIDIAAPIGTPVFAAAPGVVVSAGWNSGGYGNLVEIQHPDGSLTVYAHNNRILVRRGQEVAQGQQISEMGTTGRSTGPHCHFEVHPPGRGAVNPIAFLPKR